jgi:hypothetical protein
MGFASHALHLRIDATSESTSQALGNQLESAYNGSAAALVDTDTAALRSVDQ